MGGYFGSVCIRSILFFFFLILLILLHELVFSPPLIELAGKARNVGGAPNIPDHSFLFFPHLISLLFCSPVDLRC